MAEKAKRLSPRPETLRQLFLHSGNICAFPGCERLMMNLAGQFVGQVCHIEAAEEGGERFRREMSNETRRDISNLMLLCYDHHVVTNDVAAYSVARMRQMKADHERRFASPERAMLAQMTDWTRADDATFPTSLEAIDRVCGWDLNPEQRAQVVEDITPFIKDLVKVPVEVRRFAGQVALRMHRVGNTHAVQGGSKKVLLLSDFQSSHGVDDELLRKLIIQFDAYRLGRHEPFEIDFGAHDDGIQLATLKSGWAIWEDLATYSEEAKISMEAFTVELDFARLDG